MSGGYADRAPVVGSDAPPAAAMTEREAYRAHALIDAQEETSS
jgi:hypothetical protein